MKTLKNTTIQLMQLQVRKDRKQVRNAHTALVLNGLDLYRMLDRYKPVSQ